MYKILFVMFLCGWVVVSSTGSFFHLFFLFIRCFFVAGDCSEEKQKEKINDDEKGGGGGVNGVNECDERADRKQGIH